MVIFHAFFNVTFSMNYSTICLSE